MNDCVKDGVQYCLFSNSLIGEVRRNGKDLIEETVRSYYLFEEMKNSNSIDKWFKYMLKFDDDLCMQKMDMKLCSEEII